MKMNAEQLKQTLINANSGRTSPRSDVEINDIVNKFQKQMELRDAQKFDNKSYRKRIFDLVKDMNSADYRMFAMPELGLGIFVTVDRTINKAKVAFSFLNKNDFADGVVPEIRSFKYYAILNYKAGRYTYEVDWKGRSEFAIYDAFVKNHDEFPAKYKTLAISINIGQYDGGWAFPIEQ